MITRYELLAAWQENLRSGEFVQGQELLRKRVVGYTYDQWCCLGVFVETMNRLGMVELEWGEEQREDGSRPIDQCKMALPWEVCEITGITPLGTVSHAYIRGEDLATANDIYNMTFLDLADAFDDPDIADQLFPKLPTGDSE